MKVVLFSQLKSILRSQILQLLGAGKTSQHKPL